MLHLQAQVWRFLMAIGMFIHRLAPPRPPRPNFSRQIPTALSPTKGSVNIEFYVPRDYETCRRNNTASYPVVINFHGGGFTLGTATDDARWAKCVVDEVSAVVASVDYRLAPEHPFPTAVEDGVDAVMYLVKNAAELGLDTNRIAISGFSSGGNMAFTVPLRLQEELDPSLDGDNDPAHSHEVQLHPMKSISQGKTIVSMLKEIRIAAIVAWYPSTDYTLSRDQRRATNIRKDQELSAIFTELFDESYLQPPSLNKSNPYLSPGVAPNPMLEGLPENIILYTCEWDMLLAEANSLKARLEAMGKYVKYKMVKNVPHGWDKAPNPMVWTPGVKEHYQEACMELRRIFKSKRNPSLAHYIENRRMIQSGVASGSGNNTTDV